MKRYFELYFRHPILFSLPMVVALVAGLGYASRAPKMYSSTATVFADASLPNASTLTAGVSPGFVTPAADKMTTLQEFLGTQSFLDKVALRSPLAPFLKTQPQAVQRGGSRRHGQDRQGRHLRTPDPYRLRPSRQSPELAAGTVKAVVDEFTAELGSVLQARAQSLAAVYKTSVDQATAALQSPTNSSSTQQAAASAQLAAAQQSYNQALSSASSGTLDPTTFHMVDAPKVPTAPLPHKKQIMMAGIGGLLGGLVITIIALVVIMAQDRSVREEEEVESNLELEVVGSVPQFDKGVLSPSGKRNKAEPQGWLWTPPGLLESCTTALRRVERDESAPLTLPRAGLRVSRRGPIAGRVPAASTGSRTIAVTSSLRGEGRSTIATGMAAAAYQAYGLRTILVEFDLERPSLARRLGVESSPGVAEILRDGASIEECLHMPDDEAVGVLVAGDASGDPAGLLSVLGRSSLVRDLGGLFEIVVADLPPLSPAGQAAPLAPQFETTFLVVRSGLAPVGDIRRAVDELVKPPPVIFNGVETSIPKPLRALLAG